MAIDAVLGVLRFHVDQGGKHVLRTFVRKRTTTILANSCHLSHMHVIFLAGKYKVVPGAPVQIMV